MTDKDNIRLVNAGGMPENSSRLYEQLMRSRSNIFFISETLSPTSPNHSGLLEQWADDWKQITEVLTPTILRHRITDIKITVDGKPIRLTAIYAPVSSAQRPGNHGEDTPDPTSDGQFYQTLTETLGPSNDELTAAETIPWAIGGDWNCVLDPMLDQEDHSTTDQPTSINLQNKFMADLSMMDTYRAFYPKKKEFTNGTR
ncbi:hypothetical protein TRICI_006351 [Trichomonascus ciferrii]|uniref:Endonuclease/exonuclease/phosphatase domain-containing protein n=1 Tax=Trichomonascus ciferrii TaxID=44093 RepID=A0A642UI16_9ASCO|nr:hypothetical protein TRICI_006351 [Trichomonascus ciferrii]